MKPITISRIFHRQEARLSLVFDYDEELIDTRTLEETVIVASRRIGLCDYRPRYGTFDVVVLS